MKRTISINIGGLLFHVEEDAYEKLKNYLNGIENYFKKFEDSREIIQDVEHRIAELLTEKNSKEQPIVTLAMVEKVILTMGTVDDFKREEEEETPVEESATQEKINPEKASAEKLQRDTSRKLIGGVLAGIAYYLKADPLWIRLLYLAFFFGFAFFPPIPGVLLIVYVVLWATLPSSSSLTEQNVRKLFRDPDDKTLAGVCGGLAKYFNADVTAIRILFIVLFFFGGSGLLIYLIFWFITPMAKTRADKLLMQGEPVTLNSIEQSVKTNLQDPQKEENTLTKIILFPFRLISTLFSKGSTALSPIFSFIVMFIRFGVGAVLFAIGAALFIGFLAGVAGLFGLAGLEDSVELPVSIDLIVNSLGETLIISSIILLLIPCLSIALLGIRLIAGKAILPTSARWSLFGIWVIALFVTVFTFIPVAQDLRVQSQVEVKRELQLESAKTLYIKSISFDQTGKSIPWEVPVQLQPVADKEYSMQLTYLSRGKNNQSAREYASQVIYEISLKDSLLEFPEEFKLQPGAIYRGQHPKVKLYIPYYRTFRLDENMDDQIGNLLFKNGYGYSALEASSLWYFDSTGQLICSNCNEGKSGGMSWDDEDEALVSLNDIVREIEVGGHFKLTVKEGDKPSVKVFANQDQLEYLETRIVDGRLVLDYQKSWKWTNFEEETEVLVVTNALEKLEISGMSVAQVYGFTNANLQIELDGLSRLELEGNPTSLEIDLNGASEATLSGSGTSLKANLNGNSKLDAENYSCQSVTVDADGATQAKVNAEQSLSLDASGVAEIEYSGAARELNIDDRGIATIRKKK